MILMELLEAVAARVRIFNIGWTVPEMYIVVNENGDGFIDHRGEPHPTPLFRMPEDWEIWQQPTIENQREHYLGQNTQVSLEKALDKLETNLIIALRSFGETLSKNLSKQVVEQLRREVGITISRKL